MKTFNRTFVSLICTLETVTHPQALAPISVRTIVGPMVLHWISYFDHSAAITCSRGAAGNCTTHTVSTIQNEGLYDKCEILLNVSPCPQCSLSRINRQHFIIDIKERGLHNSENLSEVKTERFMGGLSNRTTCFKHLYLQVKR